MDSIGLSTILLGFPSFVRIVCTGVFRRSWKTGSPAFVSTVFGFQYFILDKTFMWSIAAEIGERLQQYRSSSMRPLVKECSQTPGALVSNPQAAITSVTPLPSSALAVAAAQQSSKIKTSDVACSSIFWIPTHCTVGESSNSLLIIRQLGLGAKPHHFLHKCNRVKDLTDHDHVS